jgi:putative hydrolase of the HAD superfamily
VIDALVFDFDGVVCDTEWVEYESTRVAWARWGADLSVELWHHNVGRSWGPTWMDDLEARVGVVDRAAVLEARRAVHDELLPRQGPLPGVVALMTEAREAALPVAVASNSDLHWVDSNLTRLGLRGFVSAIRAIDTVPRGKPHPDPYLLACADLGVEPSAAVAFEDSFTGVSAAVAAGLFTVAVPHLLTAAHDLDAANWTVTSLIDVNLADLTVRFSR